MIGIPPVQLCSSEATASKKFKVVVERNLRATSADQLISVVPCHVKDVMLCLALRRRQWNGVVKSLVRIGRKKYIGTRSSKNQNKINTAHGKPYADKNCEEARCVTGQSY